MQIHINSIPNTAVNILRIIILLSYETVIHFKNIRLYKLHLNIYPHRTWHMAFFCSKRELSNLTVTAQDEDALGAVVGDCQYVLLSVTELPQLVTVSGYKKKTNNSQ